MASITGHAILEAADLSVAEAALPEFPRWPRRALIASAVVVLLRILLKDLQLGWSRAVQLYLLSFLVLLLALSFGLVRFMKFSLSPDQIIAQLGLLTRVVTVELDDQGLVYGSNGKRAWSEFRHFSENERAFLLHGDDLLHMIPKRAFSLDDLHRARALMIARVQRQERA